MFENIAFQAQTSFHISRLYYKINAKTKPSDHVCMYKILVKTYFPSMGIFFFAKFTKLKLQLDKNQPYIIQNSLQNCVFMEFFSALF